MTDPKFPSRHRIIATQHREDMPLELLGKAQLGGNTFSFNPMQAGTPDELATLFAAMADVELTADERHTTVQIIETLPEGATMRDFIAACDAHLAQHLGISPEQLEALRPLLNALAAHQ